VKPFVDLRCRLFFKLRKFRRTLSLKRRSCIQSFTLPIFKLQFIMKFCEKAFRCWIRCGSISSHPILASTSVCFHHEISMVLRMNMVRKIQMMRFLSRDGSLVRPNFLRNGRCFKLTNGFSKKLDRVCVFTKSLRFNLCANMVVIWKLWCSIMESIHIEWRWYSIHNCSFFDFTDFFLFKLYENFTM